MEERCSFTQNNYGLAFWQATTQTAAIVLQLLVRDHGKVANQAVLLASLGLLLAVLFPRHVQSDHAELQTSRQFHLTTAASCSCDKYYTWPGSLYIYIWWGL